MQIRLAEDSLQRNGQEDILYGGEFQYFRIPATLWAHSLDHLCEMGIHFVSFYIPWIWHEPSPGVYDFDGQTSPERDLHHFLKLCGERGLGLMMRPGPYVYGEYQGFGVPEWLRAQHPEILMIWETGALSKEVALNHPLWLSFVAGWFARVAQEMGPYLESGAVIACQVDNETGLPQFGGMPYYSDFNPHTISAWQSWLAELYPSIEHLNQAWGTNLERFSVIDPPRRAETSPVQIRHWGAFLEDYLVRYLETLHGLLVSSGIDVTPYLNDPYLCQWPNNSPKKSRLMTVGFDVYSKFTADAGPTHDAPYSLSFAPEYFRSLNPGRLLWGVEVGTGWFDPRVKVRPEATLQKLMINLLRGVRVISAYPLHDCIEEDGTPWIFQSPLNTAGDPVERYHRMAQVGSFLRDHGSLLAQSEPVYGDVVLLRHLPQSWEFLGVSQSNFWNALDLIDAALVHVSGTMGLHGALIESGFNPVVNELSAMSPAQWQQARAIFFGCTEVLDRQAYAQLQNYVEGGGTLILFGMPAQVDERGQPYTDNPLFPARAYGLNNKLQFGTNTVLSQVALDMVDYQRLRRNHPHRLSLHTLDMMHPLVEFNRYISSAGTWLRTEREEPFWASRFVSFWQGGGVTPLLRHSNGSVVAYTKRVGQGRVVFLGTIPGLFFDTGSYYTIEAEKKASVVAFLGKLLQESGLQPPIAPIPQVETILRELPDGRLILGLINRGPAKDLMVHFNVMVPFRTVEILFAATEHERLEKARFHRLSGHLSTDGVLVALLGR
jgi:hypothetical protein